MLDDGQRIIFRLGLVVAAIVGVVIGLNSPEEVERRFVSTADFDQAIDRAMDDYEANDARTESAPQQQVVNGWVARDLLLIAASQNDAAADTLDKIANSISELSGPATKDDRPVHLLTLLVVVVAWIGAWTVGPAGAVVQAVDQGDQSDESTEETAATP